MAGRTCDRCRGNVPDRMARTRDEHGRLVCEECIKMNTPAWSAHSSLSATQQAEFQKRAAEAMVSIIRSGQKTAHDSGDSALLHHCPFCGSGAVTGGSDGSVECDYCHTVFTVQVQPAHPNMPQTIDGQPMPPPGMPAGQDTEMSAPVDPAVDEDAAGNVADPLGDAEADPAEQAGQATPGADQDPTKKDNPFGGGKPPAKKGPGDKKPGGNKPPWLKDKKAAARAKFFTAEGDVLDTDRYLRHLALDNADDRLAVLAKVREENS